MFASASPDRVVADVRALIEALAQPQRGADDSVRIDRIRVLEELKSAAAAAQARETAAFAGSQRAEQKAAGVVADRIGRGIAAQVGLARRVVVVPRCPLRRLVHDPDQGAAGYVRRAASRADE